MADREVPAEQYDDPTGRKSDLLAAFESVEARSASSAPGVTPAAIPAAVEESAPEVVDDSASPPASADTSTPQPSGAEQTDEPAAAKLDSLDPPANWKVTAKEEFKELPDTAKRIVLNRVKEMDADYTRKTMEIADFKKEWGSVDDMFKPHRQQMQASGYTPATAVQAWMQAEQALTNPATRGQAIRELISAYKINPQEILGDTPQRPAIDPNNPEQQAKAEIDQIINPYLTPVQQELKALREQVGKFDQFQNSYAQQQTAARTQDVLAQIQSFANAKDATGNLSHPYFSDVEQDMALIVAGCRQTGQPIPALEEIYQRAVYSNPATRERLMTAQRTAAATDASAAARAKAANAKRAGSSVTGAAGSAQPRPNGKADERSVRQLIEDAASEHSLQ